MLLFERPFSARVPAENSFISASPLGICQTVNPGKIRAKVVQCILALIATLLESDGGNTQYVPSLTDL